MKHIYQRTQEREVRVNTEWKDMEDIYCYVELRTSTKAQLKLIINSFVYYTCVYCNPTRRRSCLSTIGVSTRNISIYI